MSIINIEYSKAANELISELDRTGVLSLEFKNRIIALLLTALQDAHKEGGKK